MAPTAIDTTTEYNEFRPMTLFRERKKNMPRTNVNALYSLHPHQHHAYTFSISEKKSLESKKRAYDTNQTRPWARMFYLKKKLTKQ